MNKKLSMKYDNGFVTISTKGYGVKQFVIDCELRNHNALKDAVEKLYIYENSILCNLVYSVITFFKKIKNIKDVNDINEFF